MATIYVGSDETCKTIQEAIQAASTTEDTTIILSAGTYAGADITLSEVGSQKGNIIIQAADDAEVIVNGTIQIGYYERGVGNEDWNGKVTFSGITFDHAENEKHSINVGAACGGVVIENCKIIGDGEYGIGSAASNNAGQSTIVNTFFTNAAMQVSGNFGTGLVIDGCTFDESRVNVQGGNSVTIKNSTFDCTVTDACNGDSFYCVRSNDTPITIENTKFEIDSTVAENDTVPGSKGWGVLVQRGVGNTKWNATDIEVNFTNAAQNLDGLYLNRNDTTNAANEDNRITINNLTSTSNNIDNLVQKSTGSVIVKEVDKSGDIISTSTYKDGNLLSKEVSILYLNGESYTEDMNYKAIKAASGNSVITNADINVKGLFVGNNAITGTVDDNVGAASKLTLSGVNANVTGGEGTNSGLWVGKDTGVANKGKYQLILKNGTEITGPGSTNVTTPGCVTGASVRNDGYLEISEGSMVKAQYMPIEGGVKITGENSVLDIQRATVFGDNANITIENGGKLQLIGIDRNLYPGLKIGNGEDKAVVNINKNGTLLIDGAADEDHGTMTIEKNGVVNVNGGTLNVTDGAVLTNNGTMTVTGGTVDADVVKGSKILYVNAGKNQDGTPVVSTLNIDSLEQHVHANTANKGTVVLSGNVNTAKDIFAYGDTVINNMQVNGDYEGDILSGTGRFLVMGETEFTGNTVMNLNTFKANNSGLIDKDVVISTANFQSLDYGIDGQKDIAVTFTIKGTINASTFIVNSGFYSPATSNKDRDKLVIDAGGVLYGYTPYTGAQSGRFDVQSSDMIVYGYVDSEWRTTGGTSYIGNNASGLDASLTIDGTYAAEDNNNGKFINVGNQELLIGKHGTVNVINGALFSWAAAVTNNGAITIDTESLFTASSITGSGTITVDAKGWSGIAKVVDLTTGEDAVDVVITGNSNAYQVTDGNDTYVTTADKSSILLTADVNGDGEADKFGDVSADGKFIAGVNAFDSAADAINVMSAATKTIHVDGEINGTWPGQVWEGTEAFKYALNFQKAKGAASAVINAYDDAQMYSYRFAHDLTVGKDVTLKLYDDVDKNVHYDNQIDFAPAGAKVTVTVDGTLIYSTANFGAGAKDESGMYVADMDKTVYINVTETGKMFATGEGNVTFFENSVLTVKGTGKENLQFATGTYTQFGGKVDLQDTCIRIWGTTSATLPEDVWMGLGNYTFTGDGVFTAANSRIEVVDGILTYANAQQAPASNAGLPETKFEDLNRNVVYFDKTSNLTNTDIYAGDMYVMGKTVTMNGGVLDLAADEGQTEMGPNPLKTSGNLTIAEGAALAMTNAALHAEGTVTNKGTVNISGKSTLNIGELSGNRINLAAGTTLTDSAVDGSVNMLGDLKLVDGSDDDVNGLNLGKGGLWASNGGKLSGDKLVARYAMFQTGVYTISTDMVLEYGYLSYGGTFTVSSTIQTGVDTDGDGKVYGGEVFYINGSVDLISGGKIDSDNGLYLSNAKSILKIGTGATVDASNVIISKDTAQLIVNGGSFVAGSVTNAGTITISGNSTINATITGNVAKVAKGAVLTVVDSAFKTGAASYTMMLDVYNLANLKSINGVDVVGNATAGYSVKIGDVFYSIADKDDAGLIFTESDGIKTDNYTGSLDGLTEDYVVEAKAGTANLTLGKGQETTVAAITKDEEEGGVNNINLKDGANLTVTGEVNAVGKLSTGNNATVDLGQVTGTNLNTTIAIGKNNANAEIDTIDMKGGSNTLSIGSNSDVTITGKNSSDNVSVNGVKTIKLSSGTYNKKTKEVTETVLTVAGDIAAPTMSNSITLGNYAKLYVDGNLVNDDVNVGTTIKAGNYSEVIFGKPDGNGNITGGEVTSLAGLSIGTGSTFKAAVVGGTSGNNTISFGNNANAKVKGDINLLVGNDTIKTGTGAVVEVSGDVKGVETISLGAKADLDVDGDITGVSKLTASNGTYDKKSKTTTWTKVEAANVSGTEKNDTVSFGNYNDVDITNLDLGAGNDTLKIGSNNIVNLNGVDFGDGKDTMTIGKDAKVKVTSIEGLETLNASKGASIWFAGGADVDVDLTDVAGSWKNATIFDDMGELASSGTGAVYGNEWDIYELADGITRIMIDDETNSNTIYKVYEKGVWDKAVGEITDITKEIITLDDTKDYVLAVSVKGADFMNKDNEANKYSFTLA